MTDSSKNGAGKTRCSHTDPYLTSLQINSKKESRLRLRIEPAARGRGETSEHSPGHGLSDRTPKHNPQLQ